MLVKVLFWILFAVDLAVVGLFLVLGLAAAGPSKTNPLSVILLTGVLPLLVVAGTATVFVLASSALLRTGAFLVAAAPLLFVVLGPFIGKAYVDRFISADGTVWSYTAGPMREVEAAMARNDADAVRAAAAKANLKQATLDGTHLLTLALRELKKVGGKPVVLEALLAAGADPNTAKTELPLAMAIYDTVDLGPEPVRLLLDARANPNQIDDFGIPAFFAATGPRVHVDILKLVLDRGANLNLKARDGTTALLRAVKGGNWPAARLLIERGADTTAIREPLESAARQNPADPGPKQILGALPTGRK